MERNTEEYHADSSNEKRRFLQTDVQTDHPDHYTESAQCSGEFRGCHYAKLCGTVCNIRSIPSGELLQHFIYGVLRTGDGSVLTVCPILRKRKSGSHPYGGGHYPAILHGNFRTCSAGGIFYAAVYDAVIY